MRAVLRAQFPDVDTAALRLLGSGWDYDAWLAGDAWAFRFPRRAEVARILPTEVRWMAAVARVLAGAPLQVPDFIRHGVPGPHFPYAFVGYALLPGVPGSELPSERVDTAQLARALGVTLARLHSAPTAPFRESGTFPETADQAAWLGFVVREREIIAGALPELLRAAAAPFLEGRVAPAPEAAGGPRPIHNDLGADHVLLDPGTGRATALIDFGDFALGDPALDFAGLPPWLGWRATDATLRAWAAASTGLEPLESLRERVDVLARACSLVWLAEAVRAPGRSRARDVERHRAWVQRAFDPES